MIKAFEEQWKLYREGCAVSRPQGDDIASRGKGKSPFDGDVKVGEIRIFADMKRPFVALVAADEGLSGWRLVPVSPFTVPASSRELLVGERVFQLWNACAAARSFVERSWLVDTLEAVDAKEIVDSIAAALPGRVTDGGGLVAEYERAFLVTGGTFAPLVERKRRSRLWTRAGWGLAAMLVLCGGLTWMVLDARLDEGDEKCACHKSKLVVQDAEALDARAVAVPCVAVPCAKAPRSMLVGCYGSADLAMDAEYECAEILPRIEAKSVETSRYAAVRENEFLDPRSEPLSTFGLDVDTSSYTMMRRCVEDGVLPPAESVRIEEFVNYFKYDYPEPKDDAPVAVAAEYAACPWAADHKLLRLGLKAKDLAKNTADLPPCNLTFLIDVSGSMDWHNGLGLAKQGLKLLVGKLREQDHVSIVTYANGTAVRLPSTPGTEKAKIEAVIDSLSAGGGTAGGAGIELAYDEAKKNFDKAANNRVILITDGDFNVGLRTETELEKLIAEKRQTGVFLSVLGVGQGNYMDANMKKLANAGNGNYAYLDSVLEAKKVFLNEFGGTLFTVAKDVKLQVEFNPAEVGAYRLLGYENRRLEAKDFNDDKKDAGEMGSGHTMTAFYEIIPAGVTNGVAKTDALKYQQVTSGKSGDLCTLKLRWKKPDGDTSVKREIPLVAKEITRKAPSENFLFASSVVEYALLLENSKFKGTSSYEAILARARGAKGKDDEGYRAEFIRLVEKAQLMTK